MEVHERMPKSEQWLVASVDALLDGGRFGDALVDSSMLVEFCWRWSAGLDRERM